MEKSLLPFTVLEIRLYKKSVAMTFVPFCELSRFYKTAALKFLQKYEFLCVQLAAHIRKSGKNVFVAFLIDKNLFKVYGIFSLNKTILHCLPFASESFSMSESSILKNASEIQEDFSTTLATLIKKMSVENVFDIEDSITCVNGTYSGVKLILDALKKAGKTPFQINQYDLLKLNFEKFSKIQAFPFYSGEKIFRLKRNMGSNYRIAVQRLQDEYEKEEVLPVGLEFNEDSCRLRLSNAIRTQCVLVLEVPEKNYGNLSDTSTPFKEGVLVAKASTNAVGFRCAQIGGVYTDPAYRGCHYAFNIVFTLLKKICRMKKNPILFVKKSNECAQRLYKNLGFDKISDYMIAYFL